MWRAVAVFSSSIFHTSTGTIRFRNRGIKLQHQLTAEGKQIMSKSKIEYNSEGSDVDDVHISNDLPSLVVFGETISPIARTNFNESLAMKSSNATEKSNSDRKLRRDPNRISYVSTRCEPVLPVSNYGPQSSLVSQKSSRNSSINIARTYNPRTLVSRCCCCCWRHGCRCCCRWNLSRFGKERFDRRNIEQNFHLQNKRHNSRNERRTKKKEEKE